MHMRTHVHLHIHVQLYVMYNVHCMYTLPLSAALVFNRTAPHLPVHLQHGQAAAVRGSGGLKGHWSSREHPAGEVEEADGHDGCEEEQTGGGSPVPAG